MLAAALVFLISLSVLAKEPQIWRHGADNSGIISQEITETDGIPVLIKNLPNWENVRSSTAFTTEFDGLILIGGGRPVLEVANFPAGTEAVSADYQAGKLVIIEYANPQLASDANFTFAEYLKNDQHGQSDGAIVFRRIGNYITFVFDSPDSDSANALLDQITYGKSVQWLGEDPYFWEKYERYMASFMIQVGFSTVKWIAMCASIAVFLGLIMGFVYYRHEEKKRKNRKKFSDAGGLTRLNLDGLSE